MFCQHCGQAIPDGGAFCNFCGSRQGVVAPAISAILDEVFEDVGEVVDDAREATLGDGQLVRLLVTVESGGPFEMVIFDADDREFKTLRGISTEREFVETFPKGGEYRFGFQSIGVPGKVRLRIH